MGEGLARRNERERERNAQNREASTVELMDSIPRKEGTQGFEIRHGVIVWDRVRTRVRVWTEDRRTRDGGRSAQDGGASTAEQNTVKHCMR
jgi:hypothetical protein